MKSRTNGGATLAFVAVSAMAIVLVGILAFFLLRMFGGFDELQHATDSGNLNVGKQALKTPSFQITNPYQLDFVGLVDGTNGMDLQVYNRVFGQALLVSLNAVADRPQSQVSGSVDQAGAPSATGIANAESVIQAATNGNGTDTGVGGQLYQAFTATSNNQLFGAFSNLSMSNSVRMLSTNGQVQNLDSAYQVAMMDAGGPTNVYIDVDPSNPTSPNSVLPYVGDSGNPYSFTSTPVPLSLPPAVLSAMTLNKPGTNYPYLPGYLNPLSGIPSAPTTPLVGVPVFPGNQPHHVAGRDFYSAATLANNTQFEGLVPPNSFKSVSNALNSSSMTQAQMEAYCLVGSMGADYPLSMPYGYIEIVNPAGITTPGIPTYANVFNSELMSGIYLATTSSGGVAFTTDVSFLNQVISANSSGQTPPNNSDSNGDPIVFFTNPSDSLSGITPSSSPSASFGGGPQMSTCMWTDVTGSNADSTCQSLLPSFNAAYPAQQQGSTTGGYQLTAVEYLKNQIIEQFQLGASLYDNQTDGTAIRNTDDLNEDISCPAPSNVPGYAGYTGLRFWQDDGAFIGDQVVSTDPANVTVNDSGYGLTHSTSPQPVHANAPVMISTPGTLAQLFGEIFNWPNNQQQPNTVVSQIGQRMHQIAPQDPNSVTPTAAAAWLMSQPTTFALGTTSYVYYQPATSTPSGWTISPTPPSWVTAGTQGQPGPTMPDGSPQQYTSDQIGANGVGGYQTIDTMVDPIHEIDVHDQLFTEYPDPATYSRGLDVVNWNPSSGAGNLLGVLTFQNYCGGSLVYGSPNSPDIGGQYSAAD